jgi:hypothetical protein
MGNLGYGSLPMTVIRNFFYVEAAGGITIRPVIGSVVQEEQLEAWTTYVLEFEAQEALDGALVAGDEIFANYIDMEADEEIAQFSGYIDEEPGISYPNKVGVRCVGPLSRLRRVPNSDRNLTGLTDGEAVMHVFDYCNVPYTAGDIDEEGYVLGAIEDIIWHKDQEGWQIVQELDKVFGFSTIEVGAGRVVRFAYDKVPDSDNIVRNFTRGVNSRYFHGERVQGGLNRIINVIKIDGLSYECDGPDDDKCRCRIWAKRQGDNSLLGTGVRTKPFTLQSDLIQDVDLAERIATRYMRWLNRTTDEIRVNCHNDPRITPGDTIGFEDDAPGIGVLTNTPYLITRVARKDGIAELTGITGEAGALGTLTSGLERECNGSTDAPSPPSVPGTDAPPTVPPSPSLVTPAVHTPSDICDGPRDHFGNCDTENATFLEGLSLDPLKSWEITGTLTLTDVNDSYNIGVNTVPGDDTQDFVVIIASTGLYDPAPPYKFELHTPDQVTTELGTFDLDVSIDYQLQWDAPNQMLTFYADQAGVCLYNYAFNASDMSGNPLTFRDTTGTPTYSNEKIWSDCTGPIGGGDEGSSCSGINLLADPDDWALNPANNGNFGYGDNGFEDDSTIEANLHTSIPNMSVLGPEDNCDGVGFYYSGTEMPPASGETWRLVIEGELSADTQSLRMWLYDTFSGNIMWLDWFSETQFHSGVCSFDYAWEGGAYDFSGEYADSSKCLTPGEPFRVTFEDNGSSSLRLKGEQPIGTTVFDYAWIDSFWSDNGTDPLELYMVHYYCHECAVTSGMTITKVCLSDSCISPAAADWNDRGYAGTFGLGTVEADMSQGGGFNYEGSETPIASPTIFTWRAHLEFSGAGGPTDVPNIGMQLWDLSGSDASGFAMEWYPTGEGFLYLYGTTGGYEEVETTAANLYNGFDIEIIWDETVGTITYSFNHGEFERSVECDAFSGQFPYLTFASDTAITFTMTDIQFCFD